MSLTGFQLRRRLLRQKEEQQRKVDSVAQKEIKDSKKASKSSSHVDKDRK